MDRAELSVENLQLLELVRERDRLQIVEPAKLFPLIFRPCVVRVLVVADSTIDFSLANFGLRTFVETLLTMPGYHVRFAVTLAHIDNRSGASMMDPDPTPGPGGVDRIARRIPQFKFDDAGHFRPDMYDQVWLFGFATSYARGAGYPADRLSDAELGALTEFMNAGGGLFATGDHGSLGAALSGAVPRARSMRLWGPPGDPAASEVSMTRARRNDTNRQGPSAGSQFDDESDDVPQPITPKMYHRRFGPWRFSYPHPLLCSPSGVIRVMPDHPHEGQCIEPANADQDVTWVAPPVKEYPPGAGGGPRPLPEVISTNSVLAGNVSGFKEPVNAQTFGGISAYDGHRAGVGRVVTDSTWHHFLNINLVGTLNVPAGNPKRLGFLFSAAGLAHLEQIKTYFRNIAVWIARPTNIACMRKRLLWGLIWNERVMEAVMTSADVPLARIDARLYWDIGRHARDVLANYVGACQARKLVVYELEPLFPKPWLELIDPWRPVPPRGPVPLPDPVPWIDPEILLDMALGGALAAIREEYPDPDPKKLDRIEKGLDKAVAKGVRAAVAAGLESFEASAKRSSELFAGLRRL